LFHFLLEANVVRRLRISHVDYSDVKIIKKFVLSSVGTSNANAYVVWYLFHTKAQQLNYA